MTSITEILMRYEPAAWVVGITGMGIYIPLWMRFRLSLDRTVAKKAMGIDPKSLTRRELQKTVARYVDSSHPGISFKGLTDGFLKWISHPVLTFREAGAAWKELKAEVAEMGGLSLRRLIIQEYAYSIGSTGIEVTLAYLAMRAGWHFAAALAITSPLGTAYALTRRTQLAAYARKRILAIQMTMAKPTTQNQPK